jgi:hypothetical protein
MTTVNFKFDVGDLLMEKVTEMEGIVMVMAKYSTGCHHYGLLPRFVKDDKTEPDWTWYDESRLVLVRKGAVCFDEELNEASLKKPSGAFPSGPKI